MGLERGDVGLAMNRRPCRRPLRLERARDGGRKNRVKSIESESSETRASAKSSGESEK